MRRAFAFVACTTLLSSAMVLISSGTAFAGMQCNPGSKPFQAPGPENVCLITTVSEGKLTSARVNWRDNNVPVNDYKHQEDPARCKSGHFNIYSRGWSMDSPTRSYCPASLDGAGGGGYNFDLADKPRALQSGELLRGRFLTSAPGGTRQWGQPACERQ